MIKWFNSQTKIIKITIIAIIAIVFCLTLFLSLFFGIPCKVTFVIECNTDFTIYLATDDVDLSPDFDFINKLIKNNHNNKTFTHCAVPVNYTRTQRLYIPNSIIIENVNGKRLFFQGWYKDFNYTIPWIDGDKLTHNITLYAKPR